MEEIEDIDLIDDNNMKDLLQLIALQNHQISYERYVYTLCLHVICW